MFLPSTPLTNDLFLTSVLRLDQQGLGYMISDAIRKGKGQSSSHPTEKKPLKALDNLVQQFGVMPQNVAANSSLDSRDL